MARLPQEWFLNTPVLWLAALVLISTMRGPLRSAPVALKKLVSLAVASLLAFGLLVLLVWEPVIQVKQDVYRTHGALDSAVGIDPNRLDCFAFSHSAAEDKSEKDVSQPLVPVLRPMPKTTEVLRKVPAERFVDVGGMEEAKEQLRQLVLGHLNPEKYKRYGLVRNGILLYGPRGTGKTFLAKATAGEFGLHFEYVSAPKLLNRWIGATGENIQEVFAQAEGRKPVLFFIDEIDSLGGGRQDAISDPGGAGREFNNITMALMSAIDQYREFQRIRS